MGRDARQDKLVCVGETSDMNDMGNVRIVYGLTTGGLLT
jgi:hypothetical protein